MERPHEKHLKRVVCLHISVVRPCVGNGPLRYCGASTPPASGAETGLVLAIEYKLQSVARGTPARSHSALYFLGETADRNLLHYTNKQTHTIKIKIIYKKSKIINGVTYIRLTVSGPSAALQDSDRYFENDPTTSTLEITLCNNKLQY